MGFLFSAVIFNPMKAVVFDFADSRSGRHADALLDQWR